MRLKRNSKGNDRLGDVERLADSLGRACDILAEKLESDDERVQLRAAREILDRMLGRPTQAIAGTGETPVTIVVESVFSDARERLAQKLAPVVDNAIQG